MTTATTKTGWRRRHKPIYSMKLNEMENIGLLAIPTATVAIATAAAAAAEAAERMMIIMCATIYCIILHL